MRRPSIEGKDFETSFGKGEQVQGKVMEAYQGRNEYFGLEERERRRRNV